MLHVIMKNMNVSVNNHLRIEKEICGQRTQAIMQTHESIDKWQIRMIFGQTEMDPKRKGVTRRLERVSIRW